LAFGKAAGKSFVDRVEYELKEFALDGLYFPYQWPEPATYLAHTKQIEMLWKFNPTIDSIGLNLTDINTLLTSGQSEVRAVKYMANRFSDL
jgi:hypothetical protein